VLTKVEVPPDGPESRNMRSSPRSDAWEDAGAPEIDPSASASRSAPASAGSAHLLDQWDNLREKGVRRVFPLAVPMLMPNSAAGNVSLELLGARAGAHTTVSACASGAESMGFGLRDDPHAGAPTSSSRGAPRPPSTRSVSPASAQMQALSTRNDDPAACVAPLRHRPRRLRHG
jgi:3-oxoacyl-[acyl-carrier-protein] synthase II